MVGELSPETGKRILKVRQNAEHIEFEVCVTEEGRSSDTTVRVLDRTVDLVGLMRQIADGKTGIATPKGAIGHLVGTDRKGQSNVVAEYYGSVSEPSRSTVEFELWIDDKNRVDLTTDDLDGLSIELSDVP